MTEDEMVEWHHRFDEREFEQDLGAGAGLESLAYCMQSVGWQRVRHD